MNHISSGELKTLFAVIADTFRDNCTYLCEIDAQMGDGDLGLTMKKGFAAAAETIDAIEPAKQAAAAKYAGGASLPDVAEAALQGAQHGVEATRQMRSRFGKAAVFAAKAAGVADQGAIAGMLLLRAICTFVCA